jgi:hypothetical protein
VLFGEIFGGEDFAGGAIFDQERSTLDYFLLFDYG